MILLGLILFYFSCLVVWVGASDCQPSSPTTRHKLTCTKRTQYLLYWIGTNLGGPVRITQAELDRALGSRPSSIHLCSRRITPLTTGNHPRLEVTGKP